MRNEKNSIWNEHKNLIGGIIILPLIGFFISLLISKISNLFTLEVFFYFFAVVVLIIFSSLYVVYLMHVEETKKKDKGCWQAIELLKYFDPDLKHETLTTYKGLEDIERNTLEKENIFIFSSDFRLDEDVDFQNNVIFKNFDKKIKYTYFIPNDIAKIDSFKKIISKWSEKNKTIKTDELIKAYKVDAELIYMTICIYNATDSLNRKVIVKFPSGNYKQSDYPFIFRLRDDDRILKDRFYNILKNHINEVNRLSLWQV